MDTTLSFKTVLIGDSGVGKSSILNCLKYFNDHGNYNDYMLNPYIASTLGVDYLNILYKEQIEKTDINVKLSIWDTGGQEKFNSICKIYFKDITAVVIVFDVCDNISFENILKWIKLVRSVNKNPKITFMILSNKHDFKNKWMRLSADYQNLEKQSLQRVTQEILKNKKPKFESQGWMAYLCLKG